MCQIDITAGNDEIILFQAVPFRTCNRVAVCIFQTGMYIYPARFGSGAVEFEHHLLSGPENDGTFRYDQLFAQRTVDADTDVHSLE